MPQMAQSLTTARTDHRILPVTPPNGGVFSDDGAILHGASASLPLGEYSRMIELASYG